MKAVSKSQIKRDALLKATICLVNNNGFHAAPMSKIAKMANVSPATIYLYFKNKQDLANQAYIEVKSSFSNCAFKDYEPSMGVEEGFKKIWMNIATFKLKEVDHALFLSQCDNTPMIDEESRQEGLKHLQPLIALWERGKEEGVVKPLSPFILYAFTVYPISFLLNTELKGWCKVDKPALERAYSAAWDAIKL
ncbi:TetR/AcrR family transcriptional regulator [Salinimicrobium tongyeongense]|uniref:TetR/AcrR family transcriptional regulator n=1 Tax=Salinimicrobium tongyeongense TaxID=2809707 RepID=A0ABY6NSP1_9FLAO|nr:TetR/AcrR family transcriptional regulator [Salinimicrobium tongyeongense]UZH55676.1 TetR/AcrR family transcriptional regulator [Salinimicrobium tongyeongense]